MRDIGGPAQNIFVVSRVGQVSGALRVLSQLDVPRPKFVILSPRNSETKDKLIASNIDAAGFEYEIVRLPRFAQLNYPGKRRSVKRALDALASRCEDVQLWIANTNAHYGYLAHAFDRKGAKIAYFEEGLGTYLRAEDQRLSGMPDRNFREVWAALSDPSSSLHNRLRRASRLTYESFLSNQVVSKVLARPGDQFFESPWKNFQVVAVSYPDLLDPKRFNAESLFRLRFELPTSKDPVSSESDRGALPQAEKLYIAQDYGIEPEIWGKAIARVLLEEGYDEITIKHHPQESESARDLFANQLRKAGVRVNANAEFDSYSAETLCRYIEPVEVIGLSSTSLMHISQDEHAPATKSIGFSLIEALKQDRGVPREHIEILERDCETLRTVSQAARLGISFC